MSTLDTPNRNSGGNDSPENHFVRLMRSGRAMVQEMAAEHWTDFNAHDPGVTILEQLCYALTEISYKSSFPVPDYLAGPDGEIDYDRQALYRPEKILPCRPVTPRDYRMAIFDAVPEIEDLYLEKADVAGQGGLYRIYLRLSVDHVAPTSDGSDYVDPQAVIEKVKTVYCDNRNLCEDIADVTIIAPTVYNLKGRVETDGCCDSAELLAQIYFCCSCLIASGISLASYDAAKKKGCSLETILTGPLLRSGTMAGCREARRQRPMTLSDIFSAVRTLSGVVGIHELALVDPQGNLITTLPEAGTGMIASLAVPDRSDDIGVSLVKKSKPYPVSSTDFRTAYDRMAYQFDAQRSAMQDVSELYNLSPAVSRPLETYASIQNHFPKIYGIDHDGTPASAGPLRQAQARQLKAYLLFFDQLMADVNAQLGQMNRLFSSESGTQPTYYHQRLDKGDVAGASDLFVVTGRALDDRIAGILARYDDHGERRSRLLDYLLAIYGEAFDQTYLRQFHHYVLATRILGTVNDNKARLLEHLPAIARDRGAGANYHQKDWQGSRLTGFERKVRILLGLAVLENRPLTEALAAQGLSFVADDQLPGLVDGELVEPSLAGDDEDPQRWAAFQEITPDPTTPQLTTEDIDELKQTVLILRHQIVNDTFFRRGTQVKCFKIGPADDHGGFPVVFRPFATDKWYFLATCPSRETAARAVNQLCRFLADLNQNSEGLLKTGKAG